MAGASDQHRAHEADLGRIGGQGQQCRLLTEQLGAGPLDLARAQRAQTARLLIETTAVPFGVIGILTFTTPNLSTPAKLIYA